MNNNVNQGWPIGMRLVGRSRDDLYVRISTLLGRDVGPDEKMTDIAAELLRKAPASVRLITCDRAIPISRNLPET